MSFVKFFGHPRSSNLTEKTHAKYYGKDAIHAVYLHPEDLSDLEGEFKRLVDLVETETLSVLRTHFLQEIEKFLSGLKEEVIPPELYKILYNRYKELKSKENEISNRPC